MKKVPREEKNCDASDEKEKDREKVRKFAHDWAKAMPLLEKPYTEGGGWTAEDQGGVAIRSLNNTSR